MSSHPVSTANTMINRFPLLSEDQRSLEDHMVPCVIDDVPEAFYQESGSEDTHS